MRVVDAAIVTDALTPTIYTDAVTTRSTGAVLTFTGVIRDHDSGRSVENLLYEAHPKAEEMLRVVAEDIGSKFDLEKIAVAHRIGELSIGDIALVAAASAPHRNTIFNALSEFVEQIKVRVPIWKLQRFVDGTEEWVNTPDSGPPTSYR